MMSQEDLHHKLNKLRSELENLEVNSDVHQELSHLISSIEQQIQGLEDKQHKNSLMESIQGHIEKFEVEHPRITSILNDIMVKLSNIGV